MRYHRRFFMERVKSGERMAFGSRGELLVFLTRLLETGSQPVERFLNGVSCIG